MDGRPFEPSPLRVAPPATPASPAAASAAAPSSAAASRPQRGLSVEEDFSVVRYGACIRLYAVSQYVAAGHKGGYVGYYLKTRTKKRYVAIPPFDPDKQNLFVPSSFKVPHLTPCDLPDFNYSKKQ